MRIFEHHHDECGCGHDHHHEDHDHHHGHEEECGCGHDHHHGHGEECECGHNHHHNHEEECGCSHENHDHHHESAGSSKAGKSIFILENLGCAHCASKMEEKIQKLPGVADATITYATKQLRLNAENPEALQPQIERICKSIEPDVRVVYKGGKKAGKGRTKIYILENLGCAHCASKMEEKIAALPGIEEATITYATKQLRITAENPEKYLHQIKEICTSIESEVRVHEKNDRAVSTKETEKHIKSEKKKKKLSEEKKSLFCIVIGAVLFIAGEILEHAGFGIEVTLPVNIVAYLILGVKIVWTALRNLTKGHVFDENFLMSIATLGAFAIEEYPEAVGVMLFYRIGEFFEQKAVAKSRGQIMDAVDMRPEVVNLISGDEITVIAAEEAQVGDILLVRPGDRIPLDGVILEGESRIDTSPITGEPVPVHGAAGDEVTSGCVNTSGQLKIRVERVLEESMVTRILDSVENAAASKPKIDRFITRFAKVYTPVVVALALITAIVPSLVTGNWNYWVYTALSFLVMSCPCALVLSVPLAFFSGIGAGSKKGILFKGGVSIEAMSGVKAVVMDKTGTITEGNFVVQEIKPASNQINAEELLRLCAGCEQNSTHPIAASITAEAKKKGMNLETPGDMQEIAGHGIRAEIGGKEVLCGNRKLMDKFDIFMPDDTGSRTVGSEVYVAVDGVYAGYIIVADTIKKDAKAALKSLKKMNIVTAMLTGDKKESAEAVAKEIGLDEVRAKLLPQDKLSELKKLREKHGSVMFVGDGINDAPVLAGADVGAAMGSGADAAIEAADVVFMTSSMEAIPQSIGIARSTSRISVQNVVFALIIKVAVMILGLCGFASMWAAVFADTGVAMLCVLNSIRILYRR